MFLRQKGAQTDLGRRCDARRCKTLSLSGCWILCHLFVVRGIACSIACGLARHQAPTRHNTGLRHNWAQRNTKQYETIRNNTKHRPPSLSLSLCPAAHDRRTTARIASAKSTTRATREKMPEASSFVKFAKRFKDYLSNGVGLTVLQSLTCFSVSAGILNWHLRMWKNGTAKIVDPTTPHVGMWHQQSLFRLLNGHLFQSCFRKLRVIFAKERLRCVSEEAVTSLAADL